MMVMDDGKQNWRTTRGSSAGGRPGSLEGCLWKEFSNIAGSPLIAGPCRIGTGHLEVNLSNGVWTQRCWCKGLRNIKARCLINGILDMLGEPLLWSQESGENPLCNERILSGP